MSTSDLVLAFLVGLVWLAVAAVYGIGGWMSGPVRWPSRNTSQPADTPPPQADPDAPTPPPQADPDAPTLPMQYTDGRAGCQGIDVWYAMPGQLLELGATGWSITLLTGRQRTVYRLTGPDGLPLATGSDLQAMKRLAEAMAADGREFSPAAHSALAQLTAQLIQRSARRG